MFCFFFFSEAAKHDGVTSEGEGVYSRYFFSACNNSLKKSTRLIECWEQPNINSLLVLLHPTFHIWHAWRSSCFLSESQSKQACFGSCEKLVTLTANSRVSARNKILTNQEVGNAQEMNFVQRSHCEPAEFMFK